MTKGRMSEHRVPYSLRDQKKWESQGDKMIEPMPNWKIRRVVTDAAFKANAETLRDAVTETVSELTNDKYIGKREGERFVGVLEALEMVFDIKLKE